MFGLDRSLGWLNQTLELGRGIGVQTVQVAVEGVCWYAPEFDGMSVLCMLGRNFG